MRKPEASGIAVLLIGTTLLTITFIVTYLFLKEDVSILPIPSLIGAFGEASAPLIEASIRMMFLGIMGWIGSTITMRGTTVLLQVKPETNPQIPKKKTGVKAEPKDMEEAWEKALQEARLEVK